jgi:hypothetical protein
MGGESLSLYTPYRTLFYHRPPLRTDTIRFVSPDLRDSALSTSLDLASTPTTGQQERKTDVAQDSGSFHRLIPDIITVSGDGQPFLRHVATTTPIGIDKTSPQDTLSVPASSYPIKGQVRGLQGGKRQVRSQVLASKGTQLRDQHLKQSLLYSFSSFET